MKERMLVFDMDGVLVDPTQTFRRALIETVRHFCGREMSQADIVRVKNRGGYNDDSDIAMRAILEAGVDADEREVREFGRELYWGRAGEGYIRDERWLVRSGTLERLAADRRLGIFTGRGMRSTQHTLRRFCPQIVFDPIITHEQVEQRKPAPDGLLRIAEAVPGAEIVFVGDNVDDCRAALGARVRFIGIASPGTPRHHETRRLFEQLGAGAVLESVNELEDVLQ